MSQTEISKQLSNGMKTQRIAKQLPKHIWEPPSIAAMLVYENPKEAQTVLAVGVYTRESRVAFSYIAPKSILPLFLEQIRDELIVTNVSSKDILFKFDEKISSEQLIRANSTEPALDFTEKVLRTAIGAIKQDSDLLNDNPWLATASPIKITYGFVKSQGEGGLPMKTPIKDDRTVQR